MLQSYDWPGNIRQLENAVFRAVVLCEGMELTPDEFPQIRTQVEGADLRADSGLVILADNAVPLRGASVADVAAAGSAPPYGLSPLLDPRGNVRPITEVESEMIRFAIRHYDGQMSEVARRLGIGRSTLYRKLKEYGIADGAEEAA